MPTELEYRFLPGSSIGLCWDEEHLIWSPAITRVEPEQDHYQWVQADGLDSLVVEPGVYTPKVRRALPFLQWLRKKRGMDDRVGDLAQDICRDRWLPSTEDPKELFLYLSGFPASHQALEAFLEAWLAYDTGFKAVPRAESWTSLQKSYALLAGVSCHPLFPASGYRMGRVTHAVASYIKRVLLLLGVSCPDPYRFRATERERLSIEGFKELGITTHMTLELVEDTRARFRYLYLADDPIVRLLSAAKSGLWTLRSSFETFAYKQWPREDCTEWFYNLDVDASVTFYDRIQL